VAKTKFGDIFIFFLIPKKWKFSAKVLETTKLNLKI
jgi:hypothetical protein